MGLDVSVYAIVGFEVNRSKIESEEIRYDTRTGKAYKEKVYEFKYDCDESIVNMPEDYIPDINKLYQFYVDYEQAERKEIWGKKINQGKSHRCHEMDGLIERLDLSKVQKKIDEMKMKYPDKDIGLFIVPNFSY